MKKVSKADKLKMAKQKHEQWLKSVGLDDKSLDKKLPHNAKGKRLGMTEFPNYLKDVRVGQSDSVAAGNGFAKTENKYSGTVIKGIGTMHKSNAVPVINQEEAESIAKMRRG